MKFNERLNELLFDENLNETAKKLNISLPAIYKWKSGEREINLSNLITLANYFQISIEYLIGRSDDDSKVKPLLCPSFGKRLQEVMRIKGITMYYLRKHYKYGSKHFENWNNGSAPLLSTLIELSDILDCTVDYLLGRI